jgi:RecA/RadA recombinase
MSTPFPVKIRVRRKARELSKTEWKSIEGTPMWFRMRRNAVFVEIEKMSNRYTDPVNLTEQAADLIRTHLEESAKDVFFIDRSIGTFEVNFYDPRDAVGLKMHWDGTETTLRRRDY